MSPFLGYCKEESDELVILKETKARHDANNPSFQPPDVNSVYRDSTCVPHVVEKKKVKNDPPTALIFSLLQYAENKDSGGLQTFNLPHFQRWQMQNPSVIIL